MKRTVRKPVSILSLCLALLMVISSASADGLFPSMNQLFGTAMPSVGVALGRTADEIADTERGKEETYHGFTVDDYTAFGAYLGGVGATLKDTAATENTITATLSVRDASMELSYDWSSQTMTTVYPSGTRPEIQKKNEENALTADSILPKLTELPHLSKVLTRLPDAEELIADGSRQETYSDFEEADYLAFSQYLQATGCTVEDYHVEAGNVMVIMLTHAAGRFTFTYDALRHIGTVTYPKDSRIEAAWTASTATPKSVAVATPKPTQSYYSEYQCWSAAEKYFRSLSWKNPSSVTINSHTATYDGSNDTYTFYIDYSAQNGFGGYNRSYYFITVSTVTGRVTSAFGGN